MHFRYRALDSSMQRVSGEREATSLLHLEQELQRRGLELIGARKRRLPLRTRLTRSELADFCMQIEQLLSAGIPLMEALQALGNSGEGTRLPALCRRLDEKLTAGLTLSQALEEEQLGPAFVGVVRAGEFSGRLPDCLRRLGDSLSQSENLARTTKKLLLQPLLAALMVFSASLFLMVYLVPQIRDFLADSGQTLPLASALLFATADLLQKYWPWLTAPLLLLALATPVLRHHPARALEIDRLSLRVPLAGAVRRKLLIARLADLLALLYSSGIPLLEALRSLPPTIGNRSAGNIVHQIAHDVEQGSSLSEAFSRHDFFPPLLIRMLLAGERSGTLEHALHHIGRRYEREASDAIAILQGLTAPALTLLIGLLLGWIMLATIQPLYGLIDAGMP
jgi:type IV pilus assembly protein PilC